MFLHLTDRCSFYTSHARAYTHIFVLAVFGVSGGGGEWWQMMVVDNVN